MRFNSGAILFCFVLCFFFRTTFILSDRKIDDGNDDAIDDKLLTNLNAKKKEKKMNDKRQ